jgi:hypothetical protein
MTISRLASYPYQITDREQQNLLKTIDFTQTIELGRTATFKPIAIKKTDLATSISRTFNQSTKAGKYFFKLEQ